LCGHVKGSSHGDRRAAARCRPLAGHHLSGRARRVRRAWPRRRAYGPHRRTRGAEQAPDLLLLRRQGAAVSRRTGAGLPSHPRGGTQAQPAGAQARRCRAPPGGVHLGLLPRPPRVPQPSQQRQPASSPPPGRLGTVARVELAADRDTGRNSRARPQGRQLSRRHRSGAAVRFDRGTRVLLSFQQPYPVRDLRARPDGAESAQRKAVAHGRVGAGLRVALDLVVTRSSGRLTRTAVLETIHYLVNRNSMATQRLGIIMHGVTGRMGMNQHLIRSIAAIRAQGGVVLSSGDRIMPDPILIGRNTEKIAALAKSQGIERWSTDLDQALENKDDSVFFDAGTTQMRPALLAKAIRAGKHVYCEKPIATNLNEAVEIARLAQQSGVRHGAVQDKLFLPGLRKIDMLRRAGFFGRMLAVRLEFGYWVFEGDLQPIQRPSWNYRKE